MSRSKELADDMCTCNQCGSPCTIDAWETGEVCENCGLPLNE